MHFPVDPDRKERLWGKTKISLFTEYNCFVVSNGVFNVVAKAKTLTPEEVKKFIAKLKRIEYIRIGVSRNQPLPPHFGIEFNGDDNGFLVEYITIADQKDGSVSIKKIKKDGCLIADTVFYDCPYINKIFLPIRLPPEDFEEYIFVKDGKHTVIHRKN